MAAKEASEVANKEKMRYEKSLTERAENVRKLVVETRLRSEVEIANERREGSSMSKGGKDEFLHPRPLRMPEGHEHNQGSAQVH